MQWGLTFWNLNKHHCFIVLHISFAGGLELCFGGGKRTKAPPVATGLWQNFSLLFNALDSEKYFGYAICQAYKICQTFCLLACQGPKWCYNISVGIALNVQFTANKMCAKNNTHIYVARTSNNRVLPMEWSWWATSNDPREASKQLIVLTMVTTKVILWSLLLLVATVWSFAHLLLGLSDRNSGTTH